jgi:hypothetical protein
MGIQRDRNVAERVASAVDEIRQSLHVAVGPLDVKGAAILVAEVVLRVDADQVDVLRFHFQLPFSFFLFTFQNDWCSEYTYY